MLEFSTDLEGVETVQAQLERASGRNLEAALQRGVMRGLRQLAVSTKERAPYRSGKGRRAVFVEPLEDEVGGRVVVPPIDGVPYLFFQHEGTGVFGPRGQPITPIGHQFLHFFTQGSLFAGATGRFRRKGGQEVFARFVLGVKANPFFKDAIEVALGFGLIEKEIVGSMMEAARGTSGNDAADGDVSFGE